MNRLDVERLRFVIKKGFVTTEELLQLLDLYEKQMNCREAALRKLSQLAEEAFTDRGRLCFQEAVLILEGGTNGVKG